ncbi:hypothetical protein H0H93_013344 [Arthromyces matolae]|nr:hypothetical protein H0H93_013344 [Arthromyces matolae]
MHIPKHLPKVTPERIETAKKVAHKTGQLIDIVDRVTQPKETETMQDEYGRRDLPSGAGLSGFGFEKREPKYIFRK